jgi:Flp pilus assembly protein TadB
MKQQRLSGPTPGLIPRLVAGITGAIVLAGAFLLGVIAWIFLAGFLLVGAVVLSIWVWRQRRKFDKFRQQADDGVLEAEYTVVREVREKQNRR